MDEFQVDFALEEITEEEGRFFFTARSITKDFVCEPGLDRISGDSSGKHLVWRHEHPIIPKFKTNHIYGTVLESNTKDGEIQSKYEVYGHTEDHLKARQIIKERHELGKPISISVRYRQYERDGDPMWAITAIVRAPRLNRQAAPSRHCLDCVEHKVAENAVELIGIGGDDGQCFVQIGREENVVGHGGS